MPPGCVPRVRSQPLEAAVTTIPYETVAAFMSKPSVLDKDQIKHAPYVLATRDLHVVMADGDTVYARGFSAPVELGSHYNLVRVGEALRDPDDNRLLGYNGVYTGSGHVTRAGDPATLIMTDSTRETYPGDKLFPGDGRCAARFRSEPSEDENRGPHHRGFGRGHRHRPVSGGRRQPRRARRPGPRQRACRVRCGRHGARQHQARAICAGDVELVCAKNVRLPDERTGTFMVFKTFDRMSYGLIMEATDIISVLDNVENP